MVKIVSKKGSSKFAKFAFFIGMVNFCLIGCGGGKSESVSVSNQPPPIPTSTSGNVTSPAVTTVSPLPSFPPPIMAMPKHGLSASDLAVIVDENNPLSVQIGDYYRSARGIPDSNIIKIAIPTSSDSIGEKDFGTMKAEIEAKLPSGVQATLLTWNAPSRVNGSCSMSITSAMAFGYNAKYCGGCATTAESPYFNSNSSSPLTDYGMRPSMMLGAKTIEGAKALIDRGVMADNTQPKGSGYLMRTTDTARSIRWNDFIGLPALWSSQPGLLLNYVDNVTLAGGDVISGKNDVLFYFTGLVNVPLMATNTFLPGAMADHLTSYGGLLPSGNGQMPITTWLENGATGSYGTVEEPCAIEDKFPKASVAIDHYYRGDTLIEAYWKSVKTPGQGLFVGEPLAKPFKSDDSFSVVGSQYVLKMRSMIPGRYYGLEYKTVGSSNWYRIGSFMVQRAMVQTFNVSLPRSDTNSIRLIGPCASNPLFQCTLASSQ